MSSQAISLILLIIMLIYMVYVCYDHWKTQREFKDYLQKSQAFLRYLEPVNDYIEAGTPYGWCDEGLQRWLREREETHTHEGA